MKPLVTTTSSDIVGGAENIDKDEDIVRIHANRLKPILQASDFRITTNIENKKKTTVEIRMNENVSYPEQK